MWRKVQFGRPTAAPPLSDTPIPTSPSHESKVHSTSLSIPTEIPSCDPPIPLTSSSSAPRPSSSALSSPAHSSSPLSFVSGSSSGSVSEVHDMNLWPAALRMSPALDQEQILFACDTTAATKMVDVERRRVQADARLRAAKIELEECEAIRQAMKKDPEVCALVVGDRVELIGLSSIYNGLLGQVLEYEGDTWIDVMLESGEEVRTKSTNLRKLSSSVKPLQPSAHLPNNASRMKTLTPLGGCVLLSRQRLVHVEHEQVRDSVELSSVAHARALDHSESCSICQSQVIVSSSGPLLALCTLDGKQLSWEVVGLSDAVFLAGWINARIRSRQVTLNTGCQRLVQKVLSNHSSLKEKLLQLDPMWEMLDALPSVESQKHALRGSRAAHLARKSGADLKQIENLIATHMNDSHTTHLIAFEQYVASVVAGWVAAQIDQIFMQEEPFQLAGSGVHVAEDISSVKQDMIRLDSALQSLADLSQGLSCLGLRHCIGKAFWSALQPQVLKACAHVELPTDAVIRMQWLGKYESVFKALLFGEDCVKLISDVDERIATLITVYMRGIKSRILDWVSNLIDREIGPNSELVRVTYSDSWQRPGSQIVDDAKYLETNSPQDLFSHVNVAIQTGSVALRGRALRRYIEMMCHVIQYYQQLMLASYNEHRLVSTPASMVTLDVHSLKVKLKCGERPLGWVFAQVNNCRRFKIHLEAARKDCITLLHCTRLESGLKQKKDGNEEEDECEEQDEQEAISEVEEVFDAVSEGFEEQSYQALLIVLNAVNLLVRQIFNHHLFAAAWRSRHEEVIGSVVDELDRLLFRFAQEIGDTHHKAHLVQRCLHALVGEYLAQFVAKTHGDSFEQHIFDFELIKKDYLTLTNFWNEWTEGLVEPKLLATRLITLLLPERLFYAKPGFNADSGRKWDEVSEVSAILSETLIILRDYPTLHPSSFVLAVLHMRKDCQECLKFLPSNLLVDPKEAKGDVFRKFMKKSRVPKKTDTIVSFPWDISIVVHRAQLAMSLEVFCEVVLLGSNNEVLATRKTTTAVKSLKPTWNVEEFKAFPDGLVARLDSIVFKVWKFSGRVVKQAAIVGESRLNMRDVYRHQLSSGAESRTTSYSKTLVLHSSKDVELGSIQVSVHYWRADEAEEKDTDIKGDTKPTPPISSIVSPPSSASRLNASAPLQSPRRTSAACGGSIISAEHFDAHLAQRSMGAKTVRANRFEELVQINRQQSYVSEANHQTRYLTRGRAGNLHAPLKISQEI